MASALRCALASRPPAPWSLPRGVTVNAIAPALIAGTDMLPGDPDHLAALIPIGRLGTPDEVADLAMAIISNGYVTNQVVGIKRRPSPGIASPGRAVHCPSGAATDRRPLIDRATNVAYSR